MSKVAPSSDVSTTDSVSSFTSLSVSRGRSSPGALESKKAGLTSFSLPIPNPGASIKHRLTGIEESFELQVQTNAAVDEQLAALLSSTSTLEARLHLEIEGLKGKMDDDLAWLRKEYNHRFDLQEAENTRLEQHISNLKKENKDLVDKLQMLDGRLGRVEEEVLDGAATPSAS